MLGLFVISRTTSAPNGAPQNPAPVGLPAGLPADLLADLLADLEEEIKRVEAEIDKIFTDTLAQLPSIPGDVGSRMKRVQTLGKLELLTSSSRSTEIRHARFVICRMWILPGRLRRAPPFSESLQVVL
jgi:hypothetical protein